MELFQAAGRRLRELAARAHPVLVVDDAHLLDAESVALVHYLATAERVGVIATASDLAKAPDAVAALGDVAGFEVIDVPPLDYADTVALAEHLLDGPAEYLLRARLYELSGGNPLWARELVHAGLDGGGIGYAYDRWRLRSLPVEATAQLREWVGRRMRSVSAGGRHAAALVAHAEPAPADLVAEVVGVRAVEEAERAGLVHLELSGRRRTLLVNHPVYAELLRGDLPGFARTRLLRELAQRLEARGARRDGDLVRVADWYLRAGGGDSDVLLRGARQAQERREWPQMARLADAAADYGAEPRAAYLSTLATLRLRHRGPVDDVTRAASQPLPAEESATDVFCRAASLLFGQRRPDAAEVVLDKLPQRSTELGMQQVAVRAAAALSRGDVSRALCAVPPYRAAGRHGVPAALAAAANSALSWGGHPREAAELGASIPVVIGRTDPPDLPTVLAASRCMTAGLGGDLAGARSRACDQVSRVSPEESTIWTYVGGRLALYAGDAATAVDLLGSTALLSELTDDDATHLGPATPANAFAGLAEAYALLGWFEQAEGALARAREVALPGSSWGDVELARVAVHICGGELAAACRLAEATAELTRELGARFHTARALHTLVRLDRAGRVRDDLTRLAGETDSPLVHAWAAHAEAASTDTPEELLRAGDELARVGLFLHAGEAAADACRAAGADGRAAHAARNRALAHTRACSGVTTPALSALVLPAVLTTREDEIARLAARGHTSPGIAAHLGIATRTVDNHLQRVYTKLHVHGRDGLAGLFASPAVRAG